MGKLVASALEQGLRDRGFFIDKREDFSGGYLYTIRQHQTKNDGRRLVFSIEGKALGEEDSVFGAEMAQWVAEQWVS